MNEIRLRPRPANETMAIYMEKLSRMYAGLVEIRNLTAPEATEEQRAIHQIVMQTFRDIGM